ncbi:oligopeptide ABC transporter permease [Pseudogracilibacillus auburnensis]|uniref:Peptide/nickel transport system permease protein n=1 Tax=Pseudogracilibacillus auburnensis TaxID=1494959 RepID=A0A2V3W6U2_9BACI|nr:oligopeptide ABC transporter permease [Pseudogracilibacillus auburnensis]MBO1002841.1 ABC transporter permease [Pseudogracilibacillus auburnensis]PXW87975.1 peptide/nickel transport system permease protein [Pseudogracilibacillus auburnensis]
MQTNEQQPIEADSYTVVKGERHRSPLQISFRRFFKNKLAVLGLIILLFVALVAIFAPFFAEHSPTKTDMLKIEQSPSKEHILGTDSSGRDNFSRLVYGSRISLTIGLAAMLFTVVIGVVLGSLSGFYGGIVDGIIMRATDIMLALPFIVLALTVMSIVENITISIFVTIIALTTWPTLTRIIRGSFLTLREQEFIQGARAVGASDFRIIRKHFLPNAVGPIIVNATLLMATMIIIESALSFIGMGIPQPTPTWGNMITEAQNIRILRSHPEAWIPPGLSILITVLAINFIGDGLRDAFDPKK